MRRDRGTERFTTFEDRFGGPSFNTEPRALLPHGLESRAWALSSHGAERDRASDIPVAISWFILTPHSASRMLQFSPDVLPLGWLVRVGGCGDRRDHRSRLLVKADAS
jgi:hypothetical protein